MARHGALFFLLEPLAKDFPIFRIGLCQIVVPEALAEVDLRNAFGVASNQLLDAPLDVRRGTLLPAAKVLIVLDLELADVLLKLVQVFVNCSHDRGKGEKKA